MTFLEALVSSSWLLVLAVKEIDKGHVTSGRKPLGLRAFPARHCHKQCDGSAAFTGTQQHSSECTAIHVFSGIL